MLDITSHHIRFTFLDVTLWSNAVIYETHSKGDRETCEEMQLTPFYRLLYRMRLDLDTETEYQQGNYFVIAKICCQSKRHTRHFVALSTCDICQGQILITPNEVDYRLHLWWMDDPLAYQRYVKKKKKKILHVCYSHSRSSVYDEYSNTEQY